jgi:hypothetical protein
MNPFKTDEIVVLLGAGASVDAGIPHSKEMISKIESLVTDEWSRHQGLYNYIKSSVYYAEGITGNFSGNVNYNIERVVNTLDELIKKEQHPLYPFVGSWSPKLLEVAGEDFKQLQNFRLRIVERLRDKWLVPEYADRAGYYAGLVNFQEQYQYPLRVFTLNYDLCVEKHCNPESSFLERGFEDLVWDWRLFELEKKNIYLYKLHGSTDWVRNAQGRLTYKNPAHIKHDEAEMIFGTSYKLQYVDPFLFFAYELRKWTLSEAKLIICIGYGFGDDHINGILGQALNNNAKRRLLSVAPVPSGQTVEQLTQAIEKTLEIRNPGAGQVVCRDVTAEDFMRKDLDIDHLSELFPEEETLFGEIITPNHNE